MYIRQVAAIQDANKSAWGATIMYETAFQRICLYMCPIYLANDGEHVS
jgi:hypothetical protein